MDKKQTLTRRMCPYVGVDGPGLAPGQTTCDRYAQKGGKLLCVNHPCVETTVGQPYMTDKKPEEIKGKTVKVAPIRGGVSIGQFFLG